MRKRILPALIFISFSFPAISFSEPSETGICEGTKLITTSIKNGELKLILGALKEGEDDLYESKVDLKEFTDEFISYDTGLILFRAEYNNNDIESLERKFREITKMLEDCLKVKPEIMVHDDGESADFDLEGSHIALELFADPSEEENWIDLNITNKD